MYFESQDVNIWQMARDSFFRFVSKPYNYTILREHKNDGEHTLDSQIGNVFHSPSKRRRLKSVFAGIAFLTLVLLSVGLVLLWQQYASPYTPSPQCGKSSHRREWRSLSKEEKLSYIHSVQCLRTKPSRIGLEHSLYDDFPYVHNHAEESMHGTASFLPWHRYFLSIYEKALQEECGYKGYLPYWDWTLDWQNITDAPVWDTELGFGGNGNPASSGSLLGGHCVEDGPFAGLEVLYVKGKYQPHCLSRGFEGADKLREYGRWVRPSAIEKLLDESSYEMFNLNLEDMAHNAIPKSIRGDFEVFTAPNDPVFFLHHAQLDRIWWKWQQQAPIRARAYSGPATRNGTTAASLRDRIRMGRIAQNLEVSKILDPVAEPLCFSYW